MSQKVKALVTQIVGMLSALLLFLGTVGIRYEWFTLDSINAFGVFLTAAILLAITLREIWANHFYQWKAFIKAEEEKRKRLNDEAKRK